MNKRYIIKDDKTFTSMIKEAPCLKNKNFVIFYLPKKNIDARFGISSPKKLGKAVQRNKLKRRVRAILRDYQKNYQNDYDCIIIIRKNCLNLSFFQMKESLENLLKKKEEYNHYEKK